MKKFADFASREDFSLSGDKLKMENIVGKDIIIKGHKIGKSKHDYGKDVLTIQYELEGVEHITFTGSSVLINQIEKYGEEVPFATKIEKVNKFYTFT